MALNWDTLELDLDGHLAYYGLSLDDINVFDYTDVEDTIDE